ncbi:MAG: helicase HerA-like domain-containing protein [Bacteroidota bacterium]|nr:helicase HerA-like domain-containing protein [Bacteroidota bacterium]
MEKLDLFKQHILTGYTSTGSAITLGAAMLDAQPQKEAEVKLPLKTLNRHGLIAGATGTGKTVTLQIIAESMCAAGIPVLLMDLKGDLSGIAKAGTSNPKIEERHNLIGIPYQTKATAAEFMTISKEAGIKLRATVLEFGPVLFSKILELNDTQGGVVALLFKYADDNQLPLVDLKDFKALLKYSTEEGKEKIKKEYGNLSTATTSTILRKIIELESQGAEQFFGERSFDVTDLVRTDANGCGIASIIRLTDIQDKPKLFSTFMLSLLAEIYATFPEAGDLEKPKLCIFIDEAHLIFNEASKALLDQIESIIKLIRSKGVGIYFITQNPYDVPDAILAQLGLKVQHALRAFTEKDRKAIKKTAENYPISEFYKTDELLTSLGIGQALVTALNEKGIPTPLAAVHLKAPSSRIGILTPDELSQLTATSNLVSKYNETIDRESAYEILNAKIKATTENEEEQEEEKPKKKEKEEKSFVEKASENTMVRQVGRTVMKEVARGLLGALGLGGKKKKGSWF